MTRRFFGVQPPDFDPNKDFYKILGVPPSATEKDIKATYYKLAQQYHPDKTQGKTADKFKEITAAYNVLGNKERKSQYDDMRAYSQTQSQQRGGDGRGFYGESNYGSPFGQQQQ